MPCGHIPQQHLWDAVWEVCPIHFCLSCNDSHIKESESAQPYQHLRPSNREEEILENTQPLKRHSQKMMHPANACISLALWAKICKITHRSAFVTSEKVAVKSGIHWKLEKIQVQAPPYCVDTAAVSIQTDEENSEHFLNKVLQFFPMLGQENCNSSRNCARPAFWGPDWWQKCGHPSGLIEISVWIALRMRGFSLRCFVIQNRFYSTSVPEEKISLQNYQYLHDTCT